MIRPLVSTFLLATRTPFFRQTFRFCTTGEGLNHEEQKGKDLDRAQNFYRNSIRKININDKGRGKFTQHNLIRLTKLTQKPSQLPLLFEAYYNYLGHLTPISNSTVDRMLSRALTFQEENHAQSIQIFQNHNYLSYFPSYEVTLTLINSVEHDEAGFKRLLQIFMESPLIKFDQQIVDKLLQVMKNDSSSHGIISSVIKVLIQRSVLHIIDHQIKAKDLLYQIGSSIKHRFRQGQRLNFKQNVYVAEFVDLCQQLPEKTDKFYGKMALVALAFTKNQAFYDNLAKIEDESRVESVLQYLNFLPEDSFGSMTSFIEGQEPSDFIKGVLESLRPVEGSSQAEAEKGE